MHAPCDALHGYNYMRKIQLRSSAYANYFQYWLGWYTRMGWSRIRTSEDIMFQRMKDMRALTETSLLQKTDIMQR